MFRRKPKLTEEVYELWLVAMRPPMDLFLALTRDEQIRLAELGDEHMHAILSALGSAVQNPEAFAAGADAVENPDSEETLLRQLVGGMVRQAMGVPEPPKPQPTNGVTMFGRPPDEVVPK